MGICSLIMGILFTVATPFTIKIMGAAGHNLSDPSAIIFAAILLGLQFMSLFLGISGNKEKKTCSVAGIVLSAIPLAIHLFFFLLCGIFSLF